MSLLNNFLIGADPEFVIVNDGHLIQQRAPSDSFVPWGLDHNGWAIEPHPKPEMSVRKLVDNIKVSLNDFATVAPTGRWRAGAFFQAPERAITMGGHVHVDQTSPTSAQIDGFDLFNQHLEALDVLPSSECSYRRSAGGHYGQPGDIRREHGHYEYRTLPSWLFSQRVTKLVLVGTKLIAVDSAAPAETLGGVKSTSFAKLKSFYERFKGKDEDADWILSSGMLARKLSIDPNKDLKDVWKVSPKKEDPHWKRMRQQEQVASAPAGRLRNPCCVIDGFVVYKSMSNTMPDDIHRMYIARRIVDDARPAVHGGSSYPYRDESGVPVGTFFCVGNQGDRHFTSASATAHYQPMGQPVLLSGTVLNSQGGYSAIPDILAREWARGRSGMGLQVSEEGLAYII